jgi:hypothetical protein
VVEESDTAFWREFAPMADYFSPAITSMQRYLGLKTKDAFYSLGQDFGRKAAERFASQSVGQTLAELARAWQVHGIGKLDVETMEPLALTIHDCAVCGQLPSTGDMFNCAFHEGFFQALLSAKLGRKARIRQETNSAGAAGTWCRRFVLDTET